MFAEMRKRAKILIVDDQAANVSLLKRFLEREGYTNVRSTLDSRQTLALYADLAPDLILLDLLMPHMDGFAVLEQLRPVIPADTYLPILVLTADITVEAKQRALANGAKDFLTKPLDLVEVLLRIKNLLEARFLHLQLQNQNQLLEAQVRERTAELTRANAELRTEIAE
ncbi:MAG TPA: response regulator, partial [Roseiflexaceae bacterium]